MWDRLDSLTGLLAQYVIFLGNEYLDVKEESSLKIVHGVWSPNKSSMQRLFSFFPRCWFFFFFKNTVHLTILVKTETIPHPPLQYSFYESVTIARHKGGRPLTHTKHQAQTSQRRHATTLLNVRLQIFIILSKTIKRPTITIIQWAELFILITGTR